MTYITQRLRVPWYKGHYRDGAYSLRLDIRAWGGVPQNIYTNSTALDWRRALPFYCNSILFGGQCITHNPAMSSHRSTLALKYHPTCMTDSWRAATKGGVRHFAGHAQKPRKERSHAPRFVVCDWRVHKGFKSLAPKTKNKISPRMISPYKIKKTSQFF